MGISGSQKAYSYAMGGVMRGSSSRGNVTSSLVFVAIAGVHYATGGTVAGAQVDADTLSITEVDGETPNTCSFQVRGFTPQDGQSVVITLGSKNNGRRLFAGRILTDVSGYVGIPTNSRDTVSAIDDTWDLGRTTITQRWSSTSATTIAREIVATVPGFSVARIESGLPVMDEFTVTDQTPIAALAALAKRFGGFVRVNLHRKEVRFGVSADPSDDTDPTALTTTTAIPTELEGLKVRRDLSQVLTRQPVEGGGGTALSDVAVGDTILPLDTPGWYNPLGGLVASGPQKIGYTGLQVGGGGTLVGPGASPSAAPTAALQSGSGVESGTHDYAVSFVTGAGESLVGPRVTIVPGVIDPPSSAVTLGSPSEGTGPDPGVHQYGVSFVTSAGETTPTLSSPLSVTTSRTTLPPHGGGGMHADAQSGGSLVGNSYYAYAVSFVDDLNNETTATQEVTGYTGLNTEFRLSGIPTSPHANTAKRNIYRSDAHGTSGGALSATKHLVVTLNDNTTDLYDDGASDASIAGNATPPSTNTATYPTQVVPLANLPIGPSLVTARKIYRTAAGGSQLKLVATIPDNATLTYSDSTPDASLGANAPITNTAAANQVALANLPLGGASVTSRKIYRTATGGTQLKLLTTIADNTTLTATDSTADASLGANAPTSDTSGLTQPSGIVLAGAASILVAGAASFASGGGWAVIGNGQQIIRYTGISGNSLTGIPASGLGAITASVTYNSTITAAPALTGIPASGLGSIRYAIKKGDPVNLRVVVDDAVAQATIAALLGGGDTGIIEGALIQDGRISETEARARGRAQLDLRKTVEVTTTYTTHDLNAHAGRTIAFTLPAQGLSGSFKIRSVTISGFYPKRWPTAQVTASSRRFTLEDLLRAARGALAA